MKQTIQAFRVSKRLLTLSFLLLTMVMVPLVNIVHGITPVAASALPAGTYCGDTPPADGSYQGPTKVMVIIGENEQYHQALDPTQAPFEANTLNGQCGYLSNMHNETHGSESNYHALVAGQYANWALCDFPPDDNGAHACNYGPVTDYGNTPSLMSQIGATSGAESWKMYDESMTNNCQTYDGPASSPYAVRHNPAPYFPNINCSTQDVPLTSLSGDLNSGQLPNFSMITPDDNDNGHDTGIGDYDSFLASTMAQVQASPDYQSGKLAVVVTYDEGLAYGSDNATVGEDCTNPNQGNTMGSCQIDTWVVGRYVPRTTWSQFATHYSILKSAESMLGLPYLGHASDPGTVDFYKDTNPFNLNPGTGVTPPTATVPGAPTAVSATPGDGSASVAFTPPASNGGSAVTSYTVTASPGNVVASGSTSPITVTGLTDNTPYTFTVTATNSVGRSAASIPSTSVTPVSASQTNLLANGGFENGISGVGSYSVNSKLTQIQTPVHSGSYALRVGSSTSAVTAGFNAPVVPGSAITAGATMTGSCWVYASGANYKAHVRLSEGTSYIGIADVTSPTLAAGTWTLITASALAQKTGDQMILSGYTNSQTTTNTLTWDDCSLTSSSSTTPPPTVTAPGAPTSVSALPSNGMAVVTFTPPASNGGSAITGYAVTASPSNITATGSNSPVTVSGLTNGTPYTFTVTATNSAGTSVASAPSTSVTPMTVPGTPTGLTATAGNAQVGLSWSAPSTNGGSAITDYIVQYSPSGANNWTTFADGVSSSTTATVTGLANNAAYDFRVSAVSSAGQGSVSNIATATPLSAVLNLLTNGGFENITAGSGTPTGVSAYAIKSTLKAITATVHSGSYALQVGNPNAVTAGFNAPAIPGSSVTAGKTLTAACWVYAPSANYKVHVKLSEGTAYTSLVDTTSPTLTANTWVLITASAPAQKTGDQIVLSGYTNSQVPGAPGLIWDDCSVTSN